MVTDYENNRIKVLDGNLRYQRHISHHSIICPCDVKVTSDEVFVLCQTSPRLKVFSYTGDLIRSMFTLVDPGVYGDSPLSICLDAKSNLLLINYLYSKIKIFSKERILLYTFINSDDGVRIFGYPHGIALTNNQKIIIISLNMKYCIQILS